MTRYFGNQVVPREIPRAKVYAFFALNGPEHLQPNEVVFREYLHQADGHVYRVIDVDVDDEAAGRYWVEKFGLNARMREQEWTAEDGDVVRLCSWSGKWHGFTVDIELKTRTTQLPDQLDDGEREQLQELVDEPDVTRSAQELVDEALREPVMSLDAFKRAAAAADVDVKYEREDPVTGDPPPSYVDGFPVGGRE